MSTQGGVITHTEENERLLLAWYSRLQADISLFSDIVKAFTGRELEAPAQKIVFHQLERLVVDDVKKNEERSMKG